MSRPEIVIALYKPKSGKFAELETLVREHFPTLKKHGLTTDRDPFIGRSSDGTVLEIFEWASAETAEKAHDHPAVVKVWEAIALVCDFVTLGDLPEAKNRFPHFARAFD